MEVNKLLSEARKIWGDDKLTLEEIVIRMGVVLGDMNRLARDRQEGSAEKSKDVGYIEYPSHLNNGLDSPVGIVFEVERYSSKLNPNSEAQKGGWFSEVPENMHADQDTYLLRNGYLHR